MLLQLRNFILFISIIGLLSIPSAANQSKKRDYFIVLCYHDVHQSFKGFERDSILEANLVAHFQYFKENGYQPVSLKDLIDAQKGLKELPDKPILLTFDDAFVSFYEIVFPLLKAFNYPAILGVTGRWIDAPKGKIITYAGTKLNRDSYMTWRQIREVSDSGLVEIANHSYDYHQGTDSNPQGNKQPMMTTLKIDKKNAYETVNDLKKEIRRDLKKNSDVIHRHTGKRPRIMVWPYGSCSQYSIDIAKNLGMPYTFILSDDKKNRVSDMSMMSRSYYADNDSLASFIEPLNKWETVQINPVRSIRISLNELYDVDPSITEEKLSKLVQRVYEYQITTIFLELFEKDTNEDKVCPAIDKTYFPNRHLPVKADIMNHVMWQLRTRSGVQVYAWMPLSGFHFTQECASHTPPDTAYHQKIVELYEDLASHVPLDGIAFEDHGSSAEEDFPLTQKLIQKLKYYRPSLKTARSIHFPIPLDQYNEKKLSCNIERFNKLYDLTILTPGSKTENNEWIPTLIPILENQPDSLKKTLIELQSVGSDNSSTDSREMLDQMRSLQEHKIFNFGYHSDDFLNNNPDKEIVNEGLSTRKYLYLR